MKEIETQLKMTRIDEQKMKMEERETIDDIPTRIETIRSEPMSGIPTQIETIWSEPISTSDCKKHEPKVKSDPDLPPSDSSGSSSVESENKIKKRKDKKNCRKHRKMICQNRLRAMIMMNRIHRMKVIIDASDAEAINIRRRTQFVHVQF